MLINRKIKKSVSILHPYIEDRLFEIEQKHYPKNHLWGLDQFQKEAEWNLNFIQTEKIVCPKSLERILNKTFFKGSPGLKAEISAWKESKKTDIIYSVCGPLALSQYYSKAKIVAWIYQKPNNSAKGFLNPYSRKNIKSIDALLCLTPTAEKFFSLYTKSKFIPWCIDLELFDGKQPFQQPNNPFFLATGKTGRDYNTLINAAQLIDSEIRIIGPKEQKPNEIPANVNWVETSGDPPDKAIDYNTLRDWYKDSIGVCIPLSGDANDTCGYTNMLEAMAMRKPVLMTKSGCLHINPESNGFGMQIKPKDTLSWVDAMNYIIKNHEKAINMGNRGREIVERDFTLKRFNQDVVEFIDNIVNTT